MKNFDAVDGIIRGEAEGPLLELTRALLQKEEDLFSIPNLTFLRPHNISVNELIPGPVVTSIDDQRSAPPGNELVFDGEWEKQPEDVTGLALFLATQPDVGPTAQSFSLMRRDN
jgi:radical SAM superfamily enzyme YgiQ (UPF0313 family)